MTFEDDDYEFNARYDDHRERYGDPCPGCGTLRWQGDCPKCWDEPLDGDEAVAASVGHSEPKGLDDGTQNPESGVPPAWADDDIPF